ncbi:MAG: YceI family protein [Bacteroidota bacterium]
MKFSTLLLFACMSLTANAQLFSTRNGFVGFYSETPFENIVAENNQAYAILDITKKTIAFSMLMKSFVFQKELMQVHFNEDYIDSDKFPKANFTGSFTESIDPSKNGNVIVHVSGTMTMHGIAKPFTATASLVVNNNAIDGTSNFTINPADFNIKIPSLVQKKIAQQIDVKIKVSLHP